MKNKGRFFMFLLSACFLVFLWILKLDLTVNSDTVIINEGIQRFEVLNNTYTIISVTITILCIWLWLKMLAESVKEHLSAKDKDSTEDKENDVELSPAQRLKNLGETKWNTREKEISDILMQVSKFNEYADRIKELLSINNASKSLDIEDAINKCEVCILGNISALVNYLTTMGYSETIIINEKMNACMSKNKSVLESLKNFMFTLTEYFNQQTDNNEKNLEFVEQSRQTILEVIDANGKV